MKNRYTPLRLLALNVGLTSLQEVGESAIGFLDITGSGGRAFMVLYPEDDVAVVILANLGHARMDMARLIGNVAPFLNPYRAVAGGQLFRCGVGMGAVHLEAA